MKHFTITLLTVASLLPTHAYAKGKKVTCKYCKVTQCDTLATKHGDGSFNKKKKRGCSFEARNATQEKRAKRTIKNIDAKGEAIDNLTPDAPKIKGPKAPKIKLPDINIKGPKAPKIKLPF